MTVQIFHIGELPLRDCALALVVGLFPVSVIEVSKLARRGIRGASPVVS